eukprot:325943-Chlamydomonas_euryale.AAC.1
MWDMTKIKALLIPTMAITRDNYPETLGQVIIINAPMIFDGAYQVGKRMLTVETQRKIQVGHRLRERVPGRRGRASGSSACGSQHRMWVTEVLAVLQGGATESGGGDGAGRHWTEVWGVVQMHVWMASWGHMHAYSSRMWREVGTPQTWHKVGTLYTHVVCAY